MELSFCPQGTAWRQPESLGFGSRQVPLRLLKAAADKQRHSPYIASVAVAYTNINVGRDGLRFWTQPVYRSLATTNDFYPTILRATLVRGVAGDWPSISISFGTETAAGDAVIGQPIHDRIGSIGR